jgi:putative NADPH-quinone reductase
MSARIPILFAHPSQHRAQAGRPLLEAGRRAEGGATADLHAGYCDYCIAIDRERHRLLDREVIVFMSPLYGYSTPAILDERQDPVLEYGFAYGQEGRELEGEQWPCALIAGGADRLSDGFENIAGDPR